MVTNNSTSQKGASAMFEAAEIISTYTRAEAIEDGVLVDMMQGELGEAVREAGFRFPIAMTEAAFSKCVALTPAAERAGNDINGRWWDVLWMLRQAIVRQGPGGWTLRFEVRCVVESVRPSRVQLKSVMGPGDQGEPVITIMLPEED
jgi:hypothetical protein